MTYVMGGAAFHGTEGFDDLGGDELGFSFGRVFTNIGTAVKKAVGDVTAESKRAAKNPLVQTAASFALPALGGLSLVGRGITVANTLKNSRVGQAVQTVQNVRRKIDSGADATDAISTGLTQLAPGSGLAQAAARVNKVKQGESIKASAKAKAAAAAEAARIAAEKKSADLAARRAAKVAEGERIKAENARKAEEARLAQEKAAADRTARAAAKAEDGKKIRAKREADRKAAEAKRLQEQADAAAAAGQATEAARLRDQAAAAADAGRAAAQVASTPSIYSAPVQNGPPPDNYAAQAGGTAPASGLSSIPTPYLLGGGVLLLGAVFAATHGASGPRSWR